MDRGVYLSHGNDRLDELNTIVRSGPIQAGCWGQADWPSDHADQSTDRVSHQRRSPATLYSRAGCDISSTTVGALGQSCLGASEQVLSELDW